MTHAKESPLAWQKNGSATTAKKSPRGREWLFEDSAPRSIRRRYTLGLALIALLTIVAGVFLQLVVSTQERNANVINVAGRQRMLSQRATLFASQLIFAPAQNRAASREALRDALNLMERSHNGLIRGDAELRLIGQPSPAIRALYFGAPLEADRQVRAFLRLGRALLDAPDARLTQSNPQMRAMLQAAHGPLLTALDTVVKRYATESEEEVSTLQLLEAGIALLTLTLLALEAIFIFRPLERDVGRRTKELVRAYDETIEGWSRALDLRDRETEGHSVRVKTMTLRLAELAGMCESELTHIRRGALLHDIGKVGIPDSVLLKPGKLDDAEWEIMRRHPRYAADLLEPIEFLRPALDIPLYHHERWDGAGYPSRLYGENIPFSARLFAVVDIWDALSSDRPYRAGWETDRVREHVRDLAGTHLDPKAVTLFLENEALVLEGLYSSESSPRESNPKESSPREQVA
jgi:HD-GYP domain-containing protein (c-di-GMP phosphodiesterase class II)